VAAIAERERLAALAVQRRQRGRQVTLLVLMLLNVLVLTLFALSRSGKTAGTTHGQGRYSSNTTAHAVT